MTFRKNAEGVEGLSSYAVSEVEHKVMAYIQRMLYDAGVQDIELVGAKVYGSRIHEGESHKDSDLDVVVEYRGSIREDDFFSMLHEEDFFLDGLRVGVNPITEGKSGTLTAFLEKDQRLYEAYRQEKLLARLENPLKTAEMSMEQNYNQLDGLINNQEPPRQIVDGHTVLESEVIGNIEIVLAQKEVAVQPFVTWRRSVDLDTESEEENYYWGHYFSDEGAARKDFISRVESEQESIFEHNPSIHFQLKENTARCGNTPSKAVPHRDGHKER